MKEMPQWMKEWVAALRSGEYEQGIQYLCKNNKYCCLGVLCELQPDLEWEIVIKKEDDNEEVHGLPPKTVKRYGKDGHTGSLPISIVTKLGLRSRFGSFKDETITLSGLNDQGKTFAEIADIIEKNWERLLR